MFATVCILAALAVLALTLLRALRHRHTVSRSLSILLAGICFSAFFLFLPRYWQTSQVGFPYPSLRALTYSLYHSLKTLVGGQRLDVLEEMVFEEAFPALLRWFYYVLNYIFYLAAPVLTSSLILSLIGDLADRFRCRSSRKRQYHIFSVLNETALKLAEKLRARYPKDMLVFCDTKNADKDLISRAKPLGAALLHSTCEEAKLPSRKKSLQFHLVSPHEDENLLCTEVLIRKYRDRKDGTVVINAFAESGTGIQVVESLEKGNVGVRFVDGTALLCSDLLLRHPLDRIPEDRKTISVVIVGCDKTGLRMLKTAAWCGQVEGLGLKLRVYDQNAVQLESRLRAQCPELMDHCDIGFVTVDARTHRLEDAILDARTGSPDATCIVMAMGDDDLNIAVADRLFRLYRHHNRYGWTPRILARIRNSTKAHIYSDQENPYLTQRRISLFGSLEAVFSESVLFHSYLENLSFAVDLCYCGLLPKEDPAVMTVRELRTYFASDALREARCQFLQSEYRRRSSMAAALHIPVKLHSCGVLPAGENIPTEETARKFRHALREDPALLEALAKNEHQRWNQFMRSEGYVQADWRDLQQFYPVEKNNQDALSKRHLCLVDWEKLDETNRSYLALDPPVRKDFKKSDLDLVRGIPDILLLAKRMEEIEPEDLA